jgi:serine/threonine protein kinase
MDCCARPSQRQGSPHEGIPPPLVGPHSELQRLRSSALAEAESRAALERELERERKVARAAAESRAALECELERERKVARAAAESRAALERELERERKVTRAAAESRAALECELERERKIARAAAESRAALERLPRPAQPQLAAAAAAAVGAGPAQPQPEPEPQPQLQPEPPLDQWQVEPEGFCAQLELPKPIPRAIGERYRLEKYVGAGSYGKVYVGVDTIDGTRVAVKCVCDVFRTTTDALRTVREMSILRQCHHPNIITCRSAIRPPDPAHFRNVWLVLEACDWDLRKVMNTRMKQWGIGHVNRLMHQLLCGLAYLHGAGIVHRDLKPGNVLVTAACDVRIADFGLSRKLSQTAEPDPPALGAGAEASTAKPKLRRTLTKHVVTRYYRAPELILLSSRYTTTIDIWSAGCIFAELLATLEPSAPRDSKRILFAGNGGYPVSATSDPAQISLVRLREELSNPQSMLALIFGLVGTPSSRDINDLTDAEPLRQALRGLTPIAPTSLARKYTAASAKAVDMLQKMLLLNPTTRLTAADCLGHSALAGTTCAHGGGLHIGHDEQRMRFPFEHVEQSKATLRQLMLGEMQRFQIQDHALMVQFCEQFQ